ncbi:acetate--CoA ligase family protein [Pseudooceanicola onchidii]|uniref:acetate--CoA ligase family protein n=1 Tax=Pseudooceanicola onchidii TaxID=2562279 RepID=UPI0010AABF9B|nr:acetate--CoA ligase family protein [Pseudooceanicola onchidii]
MDDVRPVSGAFASLISPRSVAVIGASDDVRRIGGRPLRYMREAGFAGAIYPVNPKRDEVQGLKAYASVADLPEVPDTVILALPAQATLKAVEDCVARGVRSGVVFSAGFAEADEVGADLQDKIASVARDGGMRLLGPNCLGVMNPGIGYYGTFSVILDGAFIQPGPVGIVSQSGAYGSHLAHLARERGLGLSQFITTGNEMDITLAEALEHAIAQPETRVVMAYAEGIADGDRFRAALDRARQTGKAIVFMKTGRTDVGAKAAASHTASLAGSDAVFDAVLRQYGVYRARTTAEQIDIAYAAAQGRFPTDNKVGIFTMSGGFGIQLADDCSDAGLDVAPMPDAAQADLKALLPFSSPVNPVDATAQAVSDWEILTAFVKAMMEKGGYDMFSAILGTGPSSQSFAKPLRDALMEGLSTRGDSIRGLTMSAPRDVVADYEADGFLVYEDGAQLARAFGALVSFGKSFAQDGDRIDPVDPIDLPEGPLSEATAKAVLRRAGLRFADERLATTPGEAAEAASGFGFPIAMKICSPDIAHKTEVGGVALGLGSAEEVRAAAEEMLQRVASKVPSARIEGVLVAPMIKGGVETIVGVHDDPTFGPVVMFGLGGIFVEVLKDVTFRVAPFSLAEAHRMIREIRGYPVLEGVRGEAPADIQALAQLLSDLSRFASAHRDRIAGVDLNPVRVLPDGQGVMALDALMDLKPEEGA